MNEEKRINATIKELALAFQMYNKDVINSPDDYAELDESLDGAMTQAVELVKYLEKLNSGILDSQIENNSTSTTTNEDVIYTWTNNEK